MSELTLTELNRSENQTATTSATPTVALMEQLPGKGPRAESPLHHAELTELAKLGPTEGGVNLQELKLLGHLVLRGSTGNAAFTDGIEKVLGLDLPGPMESREAGGASVRWIAPDEWLLVVPGDEAFVLEQQLREVMGGHFAIVNVSGGQTLLALSGPDAVRVLKKSTPYDVDPRHFPVGKVVATTFAKTTALIRRTGEQRWELVVRRSFADYVWLWLQDASAEYGLVVRG